MERSSINLSPKQEQPIIIGVGASAGGLEPLQHFLSPLPSSSGLSIIIALHLSPDYRSVMAEILKKSCKMEVFVAEDGMTVKTNNVYVIPPKKYIEIRNGKIKLLDKEPGYHTPNTAIDIFFNSLSEECREKAIAVILSGTGSDGTKGIEAIKKKGGLVLVQTPETAKFDGMPLNAIRSGFFDFILAPDKMYNAIIDYITENGCLGNLFPGKSSQIVESHNTLDKILLLIKNRSGIDFTAYKRPTISRRILRRMSLNNFTNINDYYNFLNGNYQEAENLSKEFLINVTKFFRDKEAFDEIQQSVIPAIFRNKFLHDTVKIWVIG